MPPSGRANARVAPCSLSLCPPPRLGVHRHIVRPSALAFHSILGPSARSAARPAVASMPLALIVARRITPGSRSPAWRRGGNPATGAGERACDIVPSGQGRRDITFPSRRARAIVRRLGMTRSGRGKQTFLAVAVAATLSFGCAGQPYCHSGSKSGTECGDLPARPALEPGWRPLTTDPQRTPAAPPDAAWPFPAPVIQHAAAIDAGGDA